MTLLFIVFVFISPGAMDQNVLPDLGIRTDESCQDSNYMPDRARTEFPHPTFPKRPSKRKGHGNHQSQAFRSSRPPIESQVARESRLQLVVRPATSAFCRALPRHELTWRDVERRGNLGFLHEKCHRKCDAGDHHPPGKGDSRLPENTNKKCRSPLLWLATGEKTADLDF